MTPPPSTGLVAELHQTRPIPLKVSFHCNAGELLALVGPSGSGKTTTLRCIAGLHTPASGRVTCNGVDWVHTAAQVNLTPQARVVGMVFQQYALFPHMSALANITTAMGGVPIEQRTRCAHELLERVNLEGLAARRPDELSGGQQQRVALARALARDPAVLLLDEPFSSVDQTTRRKLQRELALLRKQLEIPIILVTHDLEEAALLADRICIIHRGETLQAGTPAEVMARPDTSLIARLVNLKNVFRARLLEHSSQKQRSTIKWLDYVLQCPYHPDIPSGTTVDWVIPPQFILLHQRVRPSHGERENPIQCVIEECVALGENVSITALVNGRGDTSLSFNVPLHVAQRNQLEAGGEIGVSLLTDGIHLMTSKP